MIRISAEVRYALAGGGAVVALETTLVAHGFPPGEGVAVGLESEAQVRAAGAVPATVGVLDGEVVVGLTEEELTRFDVSARKAGPRDLGAAAAQGAVAATTVGGTLVVARTVGIRFMATGGIGGVHRGHESDVSADLPELARTPIVVVCSGAKIVLDLPATREWLETHGVTVLGWKCDEMPAFYSTSSGLRVDESVENAAEAVKIVKSRDDLVLKNAILVTVPVPDAFAIETSELEEILREALVLATSRNIKGKEITPFLLAQMSEKSEGKTLAANIALLENNARVAAEIAFVLG